MKQMSTRAQIMFLALAISIPVLNNLPVRASGDAAQSDHSKHLNPFQHKGNLNKSQDRIIKKKSFKAGDLADGNQNVVAAVNKELGFFAIVPAAKLNDQGFISDLLKNPNVNGISATLPWSLLEPKEDEENWQPIDQLLSACQKSGKTLILRVSTAGVDLPSGAAPDAGKPDTASAQQLSCDTPKWVFDSGAKSVTFVDPAGKSHTMPIFWDKNYLAKWSNFVREFAAQYDKNPNIHSIGITGGGFSGGTGVLPNYQARVADGNDKSGYRDLESALKESYGMNQRQLVEHWKYVADLFPKRFQNARLNFEINPPVQHRYGEDALDEISDYLVYRYGQRVYLTRANVHDGKHGFDEYRILLKFRNDTLTGMQLTDDVKLDDMPKVAKHALDDGISFAEVPAAVVTSQDETVRTALKTLSDHIGYQLVSQKAAVPDKVAVGQSLKASFAFVNLGAAPALRPERNFDKDLADSYRVEIELRDAQGHPVLQNVHTPPTPTNRWTAGQAVSWDEELKMVDGDKRQLPAGQYTVWMSVVDTNTKRKIAFLNATSGQNPTSADTIEIGKVDIVAGPPIDSKGNSVSDNVQGRQQ